ncbi:Satratoxin biosynthesis SC1 cluster protein 4 [Colletotrichum aenigma]|uniref:Satratoxin biosynthesis SC1 cluster protein 4 n=1 Tax=Colletotrichum aenigma TaxID=1215731 RepID=UPI001872F62C|nr:Satratoxin biosynthesis SC1 cluster protein 4 [Colletotrichum aenigma]KAF5523263.1 Satratoxin biosynthesis SC1 cluster protein 4 [Colletotrichum aenigma]
MRFPPPEVVKSWPPPTHVDPEERGPALLIIESISLSFAFICLLLRLYVRIFMMRKSWWDDWLMVGAAIFSISVTVCVILATQLYGWNLHIWDTTFVQRMQGRQISIVGQTLFVFASGLSKLSILTSYLRIAPLGSTFQRVTQVTIGAVLALIIIFLMVLWTQCIPIWHYWDLTVLDRNCMAEWPPLAGQTITTVITDIIVYLLPMPTLFRLRLPVLQRIVLIILFSLGTVVVVAGIMRTWWTYYVEEMTYDVTWDGFELWIWTALEANLAIICGCVPVLRRLLPSMTENADSIQRGHIEDKEDDEESCDDNDGNDDGDDTNGIDSDDGEDGIDDDEDEDEDDDVENEWESCSGLFPAMKRTRPTEPKVRRDHTVMKNNLICMDARLREYWCEGRLALEPVGGPYQENTLDHDEEGSVQASSTVETLPESTGQDEPRTKRLKVDTGGLWCQKIRFHWMRQIRSLKMEDIKEINPYTDPCTLLPVHLPMPCGPPDGEIVTIKAEHKLDLPDQDILMLQFLLITGWAMAAGREPKHFNFDFDYDTDRFWEARRKRLAKKKARQREMRKTTETTETTRETTTETMTEMADNDFSAKSYFETLEDKTSTMEDIYELLQSCLKEVNRNDAVFHASLCVLYQTDSDQLGGAHDLYESLNGDEKKKRCDPNAVRDALNRDDGKCVLLGTADPMACHIAPFAIKTFLSELTRIPALFPADLLHRAHNKVQSDDNILCTTRNVLSMNTQMRQYWANGRFSLEPWGEPHQETTERRRTGTGGLWCQEVRFHWMRQTTISMQQKWDGRGQNLRDLLPPRLGRYHHWSAKTGRLIQDGEVVAIKAKNRLDLPDRDFLEIRHRLISAWSMAAGVEPKNFTFEDEGPDQPWG